MSDWIIEMEFLWCTKDSKKLVSFKLGELRKIPMEEDLNEGVRGLFSLSHSYLDRPMRCRGIDYAHLKELVVMMVEQLQGFEEAEITDLHGNPIDLRQFMPILFHEYNGMERVELPGHPEDTDWVIKRECQLVTKKSIEKFQLKIVKPEIKEDGSRVFAISVNHFWLGDVLLSIDHEGYPKDDKGKLAKYEWYVGRPFVEQAKWYGAEILDVDGKSIDFNALAREVKELAETQ